MHHVAQKFRNTTFPRSSASVNERPSSAVRGTSGAVIVAGKDCRRSASNGSVAAAGLHVAGPPNTMATASATVTVTFARRAGVISRSWLTVRQLAHPAGAFRVHLAVDLDVGLRQRVDGLAVLPGAHGQ